MTSIWYEVFPVTLSSRHAVLIKPLDEGQIPPWMIPHQPMLHPNTLVVQQLMTFFDACFGETSMIVHSTSWRYEQTTDQLLLTYLAVLPQGQWLDQWVASKRIVVEPIRAIRMVCGDHLAPPSHIGPTHVLAHALDHLAQLSTYDPAVRDVLEPSWHEILQQRGPKVAGYLKETPQTAMSLRL